MSVDAWFHRFRYVAAAQCWLIAGIDGDPVHASKSWPHNEHILVANPQTVGQSSRSDEG
ncbi:hypothetical protein [Kibdelosporangium philippinense]|uniref:hypothetical protein n=1 Tax=Kibdelosporangium philippinense TaxID=211113 RepID=UPI003611803B